MTMVIIVATHLKARLYFNSFKEHKTMKKEPTFWDILGACIFGAILGAFLAFNF
jgi:hypothetical protein